MIIDDSILAGAGEPAVCAQLRAQDFEPAVVKEQMALPLHHPRAGVCPKLGEDAGFQFRVDRLGAARRV